MVPLYSRQPSSDVGIVDSHVLVFHVGVTDNILG